MQAHNSNIQEFLSTTKTVFVVPVYQRNYNWQNENCEILFGDIVNIIETEREHFLGTICFKISNSRERSIIDGQQRLTSITLLLKAMYDFDTDEDIRTEIHDQYLYNKGRGIDNDFLKYKIHLNKRDDIVYHILLESDKDGAESKLTSVQKKSRVYQNYLLFYNMISNFVKKGGNIGDILEVLSSLTIIELEIQQENPQEIFESLNSTGLDLTNVDLLRNYFLMQFDHQQQTELYENYWVQIEDAIGVERMEQFFVDFLVFSKKSDAITINGRRSHINEKNLYTAFKEYYVSLPFETNYDKICHCFSKLKHCAEIYKNFIFSENINLNKETSIKKKLYFLLSINESSKVRSLLLYIFDLYNRELITTTMLNKAIDGISALTFRARICKAQGINRQFAGNVMLKLDDISDYSNFEDTFWQALTAGKGSYSFPSDTEFINALINKDLYQTLRSRGTKYLLYTLEMHSPFPKELPSFDNESISIEHIMPQTLTNQWKAYLTKETYEHYETSLHRLGNLALTNYNGELSNKSFEEKKSIYKDSKYYYTKQIIKFSKWQINEINERSKALADEALKIWQLPDKYQKNSKATHKSLHTLGEENSQFAYTKPSFLIIDDNEYSVNNWSEFLPALCKILDKESHNVFVNIANSEKISAFGIEDDTHTFSEHTAFVHITENIYIRAVMSAASILDTMTKISKMFDKIVGTDYENNIMFSLR